MAHKKADTSSRSKPPRSKKEGAKGASAPTPANDDAKRELFLHHREAWNGWIAKQKAVDKQGDEIKKDLKADGFTIKEFKIADELLTQRGEIKIKSEVTTRLRVARWLGHPMGKQLDLFAENAVAAIDPFDEGKQASMENQPRKVPSKYAEFSDQYEKWMNGYADHQATLAANFKRPAAEVDHTPPEQIGDAPETHTAAH